MEIYLGNALTASDLNHDTVLNLIGDIEGNVTFGYDNTSLDLTTDASNIVSSTAEANKALKLDTDKVLQATSKDAKKLNHNVTIELTDAVTGSATTDLSGNKVSIKTTIADTNVLKKSDIGTILPDLDNNKKIKDIYLPDQSKGGFKVVGLWSSNTTAPSTSPTENTAWLVTGDCTFSGLTFKAGDWIYYYNSSWNRADISNSIHSVNGKTGNSVTLNYSDVKAIPDTYINYTVGATIPQNKIPITDKDGHLAGVTVDKLTKEFNLKTASNGHVKIDTANSTNVKTDGSKDLDVKLAITDDGYTAIANKLRRDIKNAGASVPFRKNLNFVDFDITDSSGSNTVTIQPDYLKIDEVIYFNGTADASFKSRLGSKYGDKNERPFYVAYRDNNNRIQFIGMNSNTPNPPTGAGTITIPTGEYQTVLESNKVVTKVATANIAFDAIGNVSNFTITRTNSTAQALPLTGGTMTGDIVFKAAEVGGNSKAIKFSGGTDNANIYYSLPTSDQGKLIFEMTDDDTTEFIFRNKNTAVSPNWTKEVKISNGNVTATTFNGNATSATKATQDSDGNAINTTYLKKSGGTMTGTITSRNLTPSANNTYSVGTSSARYSNGYFTNTNTTNLIVNGRKVFLQSGTPSGASNGDIWIVTK